LRTAHLLTSKKGRPVFSHLILDVDALVEGIGFVESFHNIYILFLFIGLLLLDISILERNLALHQREAKIGQIMLRQSNPNDAWHHSLFRCRHQWKVPASHAI